MHERIDKGMTKGGGLEIWQDNRQKRQNDTRKSTPEGHSIRR